MKTKLVLFFTGILICSILSIDAQSEIDKEVRGLEIVESARRVVDSKDVLSTYKSIYLVMDDGEDTERILISRNGKKLHIFEGRNYKSREAVEAGKYSEDMEMFAGGKWISANAIGVPKGKVRIAPVFKEVFPKEKIDYFTANPDEYNKLLMEGNFWYKVFPIFYDSFWNKETKFEYVGKAKSPKQTADIIDVKSDYYRSIRLFIDEKTRLLLMMEIKLETPSRLRIHRRFYSDYKEIDKVLVARRIKIQTETILKDGRRSKSKPSQITLREFKIT